MNGDERMLEVALVISVMLTIFFAVRCLAMKISVIALSVWLERSICKQPTRKELDECKNYVVEKTLRSFFRLRNANGLNR